MNTYFTLAENLKQAMLKNNTLINPMTTQPVTQVTTVTPVTSPTISTEAYKVSNTERVRRYLTQYPTASAKEVAKALGVRQQLIYQVRFYMRHDKKPRKASNKTRVKTVNKKTEKSSTQTLLDKTLSPSYYTDGGVSTERYIAAKKLDFFLGNVVKYVSRAGKKPGCTELEDLVKASIYLRERIRQISPQTAEALDASKGMTNPKE